MTTDATEHIDLHRAGPTAAAPTAVGPWTLLREIGRGGMGAVYLAERRGADFEQRAALKLIRLGLDSPEIVQRFAAERRILARLDHPNIARLIDGGVDAAARPFLAMEWVDGLPLLDYAANHKLELRQRIQLFLRLCDAVAYAHRMLVVHRDIKPGNVLIDQRGEPKLLDFGIAKLMAPDSDTDTSATGARFFTRAYAAPEQIRGEPVTTATDIYALGAVLFELLSGQSLHSSRTARQDTRTLLAHARAEAGGQGPPGVSARSLAGDLSLIAAKAVRDDPQRRYATVEALADDLRAYCDGRVIRARPDGFAYRASRYLRRHWLGVSACAAVLLAIVGGALVALHQAAIARAQALRAEAVSAFLASVFESATPEEAAAKDIHAKDLLEAGAARIGRELAAAPEAQAELYATLGHAYFYLGDAARAIEMYEAGRALPSDASTRVRLLWGLARAELSAGQLTLARTHIDQARGAAGEDPVLRIDVDLVDKSILGAEGRFDAARALAASVYERQLARRGADDEQTLLAQNDLGVWTLASGDVAKARQIFDAVLERRRRVSGPEHPEVATTLHNLHLAKLRAGDLDGAAATASEALELRRRILPIGHRDIARSLGALAVIENRRGRFAQARELRIEAVESLRAARRPDLLLLGQELTNLAVDELQLAELDAARRHLEEADERLHMLGADDSRVIDVQRYLALVAIYEGRWRVAETALTELAARESRLPPSPNRLATLRYLARAKRMQGKGREALEAIAPAAQWLAEAGRFSANDRARTEAERALAWLAQGEVDPARMRLAAARAAYADSAPPADDAQLRLVEARIALAAGDADTARKLALPAIDALVAARGERHPDVLEARLFLAEIDGR
jgi:serine/threonine-protein kinase